MAETFVFSIAEQLLGKLSSAIFQELSLAWGLKDDLHRLQNTVSTVHAVLLDAQERQSSSHQLKDWIGKLEDALYRAEDVLEELEIYALRYKVYGQNILGKVHREFSRSNKIVFHFKMAHKIKKIREEFDVIAANKKKFNLLEGFDERVVVNREMTHSFVRADDVIGRDEDSEVAVNFLVSMSNCNSVPVLPIIGLGGMGKTTLAKMVYNDKRVIDQFDLRIWVCVSEEFELEKVIKEILKSANVPSCDYLQLEQLQQCLREKLEYQKYLLIMDDVWNENLAKWIELKNLLVGGANGSKIVITTRNQSVASIMATSDHRIEIKGLSHQQSLSLFLKWAFNSSQDANKYPRLTEIAGEIIEKCKGVPLAVRTLGSLLYAKREEREWINVRDNDIWKFEQKENDILPALRLSYWQLPNNLRRCFAFCSIYPKDYQFTSMELTNSWKANGMLKRLGHNQDTQDDAMTYIKQLLSRGFFQEFDDYGYIAYFKMHDLVHDLALLIAKGDCINLNSEGSQYCSSSKQVRHVSFPRDYFSTKEIPNWLLEQKENIHSIAFPDGVGATKVSFIKECISKFKSLRMLNLNNSKFEVLPSSIGGLKHLKLLSLSFNYELKSLPASICELVGLEALDFKGCLNIEKLPVGFGKLIRLRYLRITTKEEYLPNKELQLLTSIQYLGITDCPNLKCVLPDDTMGCLSALRFLSIVGCRSLVSLPLRGLGHLARLEGIYILNCKNINVMMGDLLDNSEETNTVRGDGCFQSLQFFIIGDLPRLKIFPSWLLQGTNTLTHLEIYDCEKLTSLMLEGMVESLKSLQTLKIINCPKLVSLPEGMHSLIGLEEVEFFNCPELIRKCQRETGEDWHKISHVRNIVMDKIKI